jgi:hypothetical protein
MLHLAATWHCRLLRQLMPFYDEDTSLLYLAGKGDANIRFGALPHDGPHLHRGMGLTPHLHRDWG